MDRIGQVDAAIGVRVSTDEANGPGRVHGDRCRPPRRLGHEADGILVTAVSPKAFSQAIGMLRRRGTMALVGLPPGDFPLPIFQTVLSRITVRGSIVGTRQDLAECLAFAGEGKVKSHVSWEPLEAMNEIFHRMEKEKIEGRIVMRI